MPGFSCFNSLSILASYLLNDRDVFNRLKKELNFNQYFFLTTVDVHNTHLV